MSNKFQYLTYAGFHITTSEGYHILIDPFLDGNPAVALSSDDIEKVDLILVSHGPFNHVGDAAKLAIKHGCKLICPFDVKMLMLDRGVPKEQVIEITWGLATQVDKIRIKAIENHHRSNVKLSDGTLVSGTPVCFLLTLEDGTRVYHSGDTALFSDMKLQGELYRPHVGLVNVTGDFELDPDYCSAEMSPYEAALACQWLGLEVVICCHYTTLPNKEVSEFLGIMESMAANAVSPVKTVAMNPLGTYEYSCRIKEN